MTNHVLKTYIKYLVAAPQLAADAAMQELSKPEDKDELKRILHALKIETKSTSIIDDRGK